MADKLVDLAEAAALVPHGATICLGGFTTQRHPMAFVYELVRLRRRNLYLFGHSPGGERKDSPWYCLMPAHRDYATEEIVSAETH